MKTYMVAITEVVEYLIPVEAETAEEARELADDVFCDLEDTSPYFVAVSEREIDGVNPPEAPETPHQHVGVGYCPTCHHYGQDCTGTKGVEP